MATVKMLKMDGSPAGDVDLSDDVFGIEINEYAVHETVKNYLANQRQGTQSAKTRSEVRGGGKKPFRQKGTGRARQGSSVAPNHVGGGIVFAPKPRDYRYSIPKKERRLAMKSVLTSKVQENEIIVIEDLTFEGPKTKEMISFLKNVNAAKKALIVTAAQDDAVVKSASNIPNVETTYVGRMNVYEILNYTSFIVTKDAAEKIQEVYSA
ncbi:MAG: 50S ribosomal protein L4 [Clostridiales Family XIII bacterium]|jgi:large subunit ribosomal protein L4|nr:50S ribosomal protein L4 [Clostridiales Family XIII bacterium]